MSGRARPVRIRERKPLTENWFKLERVSFDLRRADGSQQTLAREVYHNGPGAAVLPMTAPEAWYCWCGSCGSRPMSMGTVRS